MEPSTYAIRRLGVFIALVAAIFAVAVVRADAVAAATGPGIIVKVEQASSARASYFKVAARSGGRVRAGSLLLVNPGAHAVSVRLDPVDAITASTLGSAYQLSGGAIHASTTWLRVSRRQVIVPPHGEATVAVTTDVPRSARPGDYLAGVAVEALGQAQGVTVGRQMAISEIYRYAIGVETNLPGPREPLVRFTGALLRREASGLTFYLLAHNAGNVILTGVHGWVKVTRGNRTVASLAIAPDTFVSATGIAYPILTRGEQPPEGTVYRVRAALYYAGRVADLDTRVTFGHAAAVEQQLYGGPKVSHGFPWWWIVVGCVALLATVFLVARRRRLMRRSRALKLIRRELERPHAPLSVIRIGLRGAARRQLAKTLRPRMRRTDRLCDFAEDGLMVVLPDTSAVVADGVASDLASALERARLEASVDGVGTTTALDHVDPLELIAAARGREGAASYADGS